MPTLYSDAAAGGCPSNAVRVRVRTRQLQPTTTRACRHRPNDADSAGNKPSISESRHENRTRDKDIEPPAPCEMARSSWPYANAPCASPPDFCAPRHRERMRTREKSSRRGGIATLHQQNNDVVSVATYHRAAIARHRHCTCAHNNHKVDKVYRAQHNNECCDL
jgi:hypothetical protein